MSKRVSVCVLLLLAVIGANLGFLNWKSMELRERMNHISIVTEMRDQSLYQGLCEMHERTKALAEIDQHLQVTDDIQNQYIQQVSGQMNRMGDVVLDVGQKLVEHENRIPTLIAEKMPTVVSIRMQHAFQRNPYTGELVEMNATGVVIREDGIILTASHVVNDPEMFASAGRFWVEFSDGIEREVLRVAFAPDMNPDVAVLWIDPEGLDLQAAELVWDNALTQGEQVLVLGNPYGNGHSASTGIISCTERMDDGTSGIMQPFIQVDSPINGGNSGGPVFDMDGNMIGIVSWHYSDADGLDFLVPMHRVARGLGCLCAPIDVVLFGDQ